MADVKMTIDGSVLDEIRKVTGKSDPEIVSDALALLKWAVNETSDKRMLLSTDDKGENAKEPVLNTLTAAKS